MSNIELLGKVQAVLFADHGIEGFHPFLLGAYRHVMSMRGLPLKIVRDDPDAMLLAGPDDYTVAIKRHAYPAEPAQYQSALASPVTALLTPDIAARLARHRSHVVIEVRRESSEPLVRAKALLDLVSTGAQGQSTDALLVLQKQIDAMIELIRALTGFEPASAVFFPRSNMLMSLDAFRVHARPGPSLLTIHPKLFSQDGGVNIGAGAVGVHTAGAADFIGREIYIPVSSMPWEELVHGALEFVKAAIQPGGHITRDGGILRDEHVLRAYEIAHVGAEAAPAGVGRPLYQMTPISGRIEPRAPRPRVERRSSSRPDIASPSPSRSPAPSSAGSTLSSPSFMPPPLVRGEGVSQSFAPPPHSIARPAMAQTPQKVGPTPPPLPTYASAPPTQPPTPQPRPVEIQSLARQDMLQRVGERPAAGSFARGLQGLAPAKSLFGRK